MDINEMLRSWLASLTILHRAHWQAARHYEGRNLWLGMMATVCAAVSGTTVFATLESLPSVGVRIAIGAFGVLAAVLSSLQTFFRSAELTERHKAAAIKYSALRRDLEQDLALGTGNATAPAVFDEFRSRWDALDSEEPAVPNGIISVRCAISRRARQQPRAPTTPATGTR